MKLGSAFQKVNVLRDIKADYEILCRSYFPQMPDHPFDRLSKNEIESGIDEGFREALAGIKRLPQSSRFGVCLAYQYYKTLFEKIKTTPAENIFEQRIRVPQIEKLFVMIRSYVPNKTAML